MLAARARMRVLFVVVFNGGNLTSPRRRTFTCKIRREKNMKLACNVAIGNRLMPAQSVKHVKSTLALCKHPKSAVYCVILFTAQNKTGVKYELKANLLQLLTRFANDGKSTIQFKRPPHDLYVQADALQLKSFLHLLKRALSDDRELVTSCSSMSVTPLSSRSIPPKKLVIKSRSDYPPQGLPRTLEVLHINDVQRCSLDVGILRLAKLKVLDLSNNCIECLPQGLSALPSLCELNLSHNCLGKASPKQWGWIGGALPRTLRSLNLSHNELKFLPEGLARLHALISLHADHNRLKSLPSGIGNLRSLRVLTASNNAISSLPGSVKKLRLQNVDFFNNDFDSAQTGNPIVPLKPLPVSSLKECAAKKVLNARLTYSLETLPATLVRYMELARYCVCGEACFDVFLRQARMLLLTSIAQSYTVSSGGSLYVPIDCYFCSLRCFSASNYNRGRNPVT